MSRTEAYSLPARLAHWLAALLIVITFFAGLTMVRVGQGRTQDLLFDWHRSLGATVLALAVSVAALTGAFHGG